MIKHKVYDIMNYLRSEDQSLTGMLLLLDFEKAFDTLNWEYIFQTLSAYNFGPSFINRIVYKNASSSVTNNGYKCCIQCLYHTDTAPWTYHSLHNSSNFSLLSCDVTSVLPSICPLHHYKLTGMDVLCTVCIYHYFIEQC